MRPRNLALERELTELAARVAGHVRPDGNGDPRGLDEFANWRAADGKAAGEYATGADYVRQDRDLEHEAREELADCRNYLVWAVEADWSAYQAGDVLAGERVARRLGALSKVVGAWHDLLV